MLDVTASINAADPVPGASVMLTCANEIPMVPITWLWPGWLAQGKVHLLAGAPGQGKTTIALSFAASVSSGGVWPDGTHCAPGSVLIWTGEDDPGDTLNPRLAAMRADLAHIHYVQGMQSDEGKRRPFNPATDMPMLQARAQAIGDARLIVIDPVVSAIAGDSHRNAEVRQGMQPLVDLADATGAAVIGITHLTKGSAGREPTERVIGSIAFAAVARVVLLAARVKGDDGESRRVLVRSKSNIGSDEGGFQYHLDLAQASAGIDASIVAWGDAVTGTARELLAEAEKEPDGESGAVASAAEFLRELLADGTMPSKQVKADAIDAGYAWRTIRRAANDLGVVIQRSGFGVEGSWSWYLPKLPDFVKGVQENPKMSNKNSWTPLENLDTFGDSSGTHPPPPVVPLDAQNGEENLRKPEIPPPPVVPLDAQKVDFGAVLPGEDAEVF